MSAARLSPFESIMWRAGHDPRHRSTVGALLVLDHPPAEDDFVAQVGRAIERAPRLLLRPVDSRPLNIRPSWARDEDVDPRHHVRFVDVPSPGTMRQVLDVVSLLEATPFDAERSPWDLTILRSLENGRAALYARAHHVLTDGIGGLGILQVFFDRDERKRAADSGSTSSPWAGDGPAGNGHNGTAQGGSTVAADLRRAAQSLSGHISATRDTQPLETLVRGFQQALSLADSVSRQMLVTGGPLSPLPGSHSVMNSFDVLSVPHARQAATALGGSRNDLLVVAAATAVALYAERLGQPCSNLRVATPTRQRRDGALGGNWFAPTRTEVPAATTHPNRQFGIVSERLARARHEPMLAITDALIAAVSLLPDRVLLPALHAQVNAVDLAVTTIPGIRGRRRMCGAVIEEIYPLGPRLGVPLNVTAIASGDRLDIGVTLDPAAITMPQAFRECFDEAFQWFNDRELLDVAR